MSDKIEIKAKTVDEAVSDALLKMGADFDLEAGASRLRVGSFLIDHCRARSGDPSLTTFRFRAFRPDSGIGSGSRIGCWPCSKTPGYPAPGSRSSQGSGRRSARWPRKGLASCGR